MRLKRALITLTAYLTVIVGGQLLGVWLMEQIGFDIRVYNEHLIHRVISAAMLVYIVLMALPFVPAVEIGLALMLMFGPKICPLVYLGTVAALLLAYLSGRLIPVRLCALLFDFVGLNRARDLVLRLAPLDTGGRLKLLLGQAPTRVAPFLLRHRYLALAAALNLPGNALIGGGGGIALMAGMSGLFTGPVYLLTVVLAVAPVPVLIILTGAMF